MPDTTAADRIHASMTESAVKEVARHTIAAATRSNPPDRDDYPDIGEDDWQAVQAEIGRLLRQLAAQQEKFDAAYKFLAGRAGQPA